MPCELLPLLTGQTDSPLLTCAKLHVHKIIKEDGEAPRQERVGHALSLQVLGTEGPQNRTKRWARPCYPGLTVPTPKFSLPG